ncbi:unnamed protein product [Adineta ricciae]|uniref:Phage tail collar domain-containing protein n=2 Tax=Adineta ricciae TaxID=249248 RepID=A0A815JLE8_ADIRI|nr:unnamed protein product [Adineta ricciae]
MKTSTSFVSITGDQLKAAASKTIADGENTNAQYIHRDQASKFIGKYTMNMKKLIYSDNPQINAQALSDGLETQFLSLLQQAMQDSTMERLRADALQQVWSPSDLDPDVLEHEINKMFSYNQSETERHNDSRMYFNGNVEEIKQSASKGSGGIFGSIGRGFLKVFSLGLSGSGESSSTTTTKNHTITDQVMSETDIQKHLSQHAMDTEWNGKKLRPKEFKVHKLSDITDHLQIAIISKQLTVDKEQNAIVRIISTMNTPYSIANNQTRSNLVLTGEIKIYAGINKPPYPWLLCDGAAVSRIEYQRLFAVIGTQYGAGDYVTTFNVPDFRGRVPIGVDQYELRVKQVTETGFSGGAAVHTLTIAQLPPHQHTAGSLVTSTAGDHTHSIYDPGHNHGGSTGSAPMGTGPWGMRGGGHGSDQNSHTHTIYTGQTNIRINSAGAHNHMIHGNTSSVGNGDSFSLLQPYQSIHYIIYAD